MTDEQKPREFTSAQKALIEEHRDMNVDDYWWYETVLDDWVEKLEGLGIRVDTGGHNRACGRGRPAIYFSGFWSQGDGACFEGRIDMKQFIAAHDLGKEYPAAEFFAKRDEIYANIAHTGHYSHRHSTTFTFEDDILNSEEEGSLREAQYETMARLYSDSFDAFECDVKVICRGYMDQIYKDLEKEYEYQTSDEAVWESLEANGMLNELEEDDEEILAHAA